MTTYDGTSENMGKHGLMLYILRMVTMKNTKELELGFSAAKFFMQQFLLR